MRILSGEIKGRKIEMDKKSKARPTMSKMREALFAVLGSDLGDTLDLFGGTGSLTFEALSRGANYSVIIEKERITLENIISNINRFNFSDKCRAYLNRAEVALDILAKKNMSFDTIFIDPPYFYQNYNFLLNKILTNKIVKENGRIVVEYHKKAELSFDKFIIVKNIKVGSSITTILEVQNG